MKLATVLISRAPAVIAQMGNDKPRRLDLSDSILDIIRAKPADVELSYKRGQIVYETQYQFLAPIPQPGKILAIGQNYMDHCREQNITPPTKPLIFAKMPSAINAPDALVTWDPVDATAVDYEGELAVIFGKETRLVTPERALDHIFGYTIANDVTARDLQKGDGQWTRAKGLDTFCPMGPWLVTADEIPDPQNVPIRTTVNGVVRQNSNTKEMIFDVKTLIAYISRAFTLYPGDILLTGTPAGVGNYMKPPALLHDGDEVVIEIEVIGQLRNKCRQLTFRAR